MAMYPCLSLPPLSFPTLTGSLVTFNSQYAGLPLKSHTVDIDSVSGVSGIHIQNTAGINQWDEQWEVGTYNSSGQKTVDNRTIRNKNLIRITPSNTYYAQSAGVALVYYFYDANRNFISTNYVTNNTFTSPSNAYYMNFRMSADYGNVYNNNISINYPSTDTSYHAFVGQSFTIQIGSTVYGGEYDARTGVLTVTYGCVDLGTLTWGYSGIVFYSNVIATLNAPTNNIICSLYETVPYNIPSANMPDNSIKCYGGAENKIIYIKDSDYTDPAVFKTAMSGVQLVYELATQQTIQLPPCPIDTLEGVNNIWADTGDTTLQYPKFG